MFKNNIILTLGLHKINLVFPRNFSGPWRFNIVYLLKKQNKKTPTTRLFFVCFFCLNFSPFRLSSCSSDDEPPAGAASGSATLTRDGMGTKGGWRKEKISMKHSKAAELSSLKRSAITCVYVCVSLAADEEAARLVSLGLVGHSSLHTSESEMKNQHVKCF